MSDDLQSRYEALEAEADPTPDTAPVPERTLDRLADRFGDKLVSGSEPLNQPAIVVSRDALTELMEHLRDDEGFALLSSLTATDCHGEEPRFYVVYHLTNVQRAERLRVKVGATEAEPRVDSVTPIWPGANFLEREVYDLFGIEFEGHPNLKRIMLPEEWEGHPLRKDYPLVYETVQFSHNVDEISRTKPFAES